MGNITIVVLMKFKKYTVEQIVDKIEQIDKAVFDGSKSLNSTATDKSLTYRVEVKNKAHVNIKQS